VTLRADTQEKTKFVLDTTFTRVSARSYNDAYVDSMSFRLSGV
jgi:hypothetical protein